MLLGVCLVGLVSCKSALPHVPSQARWDCEGDSLSKAWESIRPSIADADEAQALANAVLCMPESAHPKSYIDAHLGESVELSFYGTGELEPEREVLSKATAKGQIPNYGEARDRTYSVKLKNQDDIELEAASDACIDTVVLGTRRVGLSWNTTAHATEGVLSQQGS
ncbi:hypothetical protein [Lysobacter terrae]